MALTRKFLTAMGIDADKIDEIITAHTESLEGVKADRDKYKADAAQLATVQAELDALKAKGEDGENPYQKKYEDEHQKFEDYKKEVAGKELRAKKEAAYKEVLKDAGISEKGMAKVLKYTDWDTVEIDDDDKIKDAKKHIKEVKEEWSELIVKEGARGAETSHPPKNSGGGTMTKEDIYKKDEHGRYVLDATARQKALSELMSNN